MTILTIGSDAHRRMSYFADLIFVLVQKEIPVTPFQRPCMTAIRRDHVSKAYPRHRHLSRGLKESLSICLMRSGG